MAQPLAPDPAFSGPATALHEIADRDPRDAQRQALREATAHAVAASKRIEDARGTVPGEMPPPARILDNLVHIGYPLGWVVEEVVYRWGNAYLLDLISHATFLYGQSSKDLLRSAIEEGGRRRAEARAAARRKLRANDGDLSALSPEERAMLHWEPVDWALVGLAEAPLDLRFLLPNDDPGGTASAQ